jgi:phage terminase large subunit GpA-like protein
MAALAKAWSLWTPPPRLNPSEWIEQEFVLPQDESATPGRYKFTRHAFLKEIADSFVDPECEDVIVRKCAQVGWTTLFVGIVGYFIATDPGRTLVVQPTENEAEIWSKDRFDPIARATPAISSKIRPTKSRDANNKILHKKYAGGALKMVGATSPTGLASYPAKRSLLDEVDRYPLSSGDEGSAYWLVRKRSQTYLRKGGKIGAGSTPGIEQTSQICALEQMGDQRRWLVPCHECDSEQELDFFKGVRWDKDEKGKHLPETAAYVCEHCGCLWSDLDRIKNVAKGRWQATAVGQGKMRSYFIAGLLSPEVGHVELATKWVGCRDDQTRKVFFNTDLGLPWKERGDAPEWQRLYDRRETWPADKLPAAVRFLTCGVDVQVNRLEYAVWGWCRDGQRFLIENGSFPGRPSEPEPWAQLDELVSRTWQHAGGAYLKLARLAIDHGYASREVEAWARTKPGSLVMVVKGSHGGPALGVPRRESVSASGKRLKSGVKIWPVNGSPLKSQLYGHLRLEAPVDGQPYPPNYVHISTRADDETVKQLVAEQLVTVVKRGGYTALEWQKTRDRNEALDTAVYSHAAALAVGMDRFSPRKWAEIEAALGVETGAADDGANDSAFPPPPPPQRPATPPRVERVARGRRVHHPVF